MIIRIVKVTLLPGKRNDFLRLFSSVCPDIRAFPGCNGVEVLSDTTHPDLAFTISRWDSEDHLEAYRQSQLFTDTWRQARQLFAARADAWSLDPVNPGPTSPTGQLFA